MKIHSSWLTSGIIHFLWPVSYVLPWNGTTGGEACWWRIFHTEEGYKLLDLRNTQVQKEWKNHPRCIRIKLWRIKDKKGHVMLYLRGKPGWIRETWHLDQQLLPQSNNRCLKIVFERSGEGASLLVQWSRTHLPMRGTQVWSLVWELRPKCQGATKPVSYNYRSLRTPTTG